MPVGVGPARHVMRLAIRLAHGVMLAGHTGFLVGVPEIAIGAAVSVGFGEPSP